MGSCPIRTEIYGGLPSVGGFGSIMEFGVGLGIVFEAAHCLLGSLGKNLGKEDDWLQMLGIEKGHLNEEAGIITKTLREYARPIYREQMLDFSPYKPEWQERMRESAERQVEDIQQAGPKLAALAKGKARAFKKNLETEEAPVEWVNTVGATYLVVIELAEAAVKAVADWPDSMGNPFADPKVTRAAGLMEKHLAALFRWGSFSIKASKNEPTNPGLWAKVQSLAKGEQQSFTHDGKTINGPNEGKGFEIFPSAYANGWASKTYGDLGGGWKKKARGKAKKDVGHGGLDEWFSGDATWGDWVSISPVKKTLDSGKEVEPGDIVGPCGVSDDPDWKEITKGGEDPLKCMPRQKAYDMPKAERAQKAQTKQEAEKADGSRGKKPTMTPTFEKDARLQRARLRSQWEVYRPLSEIDPGTQDLLDTPTPEWLDRDYPYVTPPGHQGTLKELDYLASLAPLREHYRSFLAETDENMTHSFVMLAEELGVPVNRDVLGTVASEAAVLITKLKWLYNRPRPYQVAQQAGVDFTPMDSKTAHTPAYPSGHTIQGYLMASHLSGVAPQHRAAFMDLAHRCSWGRVVAGYHWPSDVVFGKDIYRHIVHGQMPAAIRVASRQRVARRYAAQKFQWTRSPLSYNVSGTAKRLGLIDSEAGDPDERETYFAETQKELRKKNYQRYKKRRFETVPGAEPGTVAFLDYHEFPNYYDDGKTYLYLDYVSTRNDRLGQGHARKLFEGLLKKHGKDAHYDFGRIAHKAVYKIFRDWQSRGINVRGKNWGGWTDEEVGLRSASVVRVLHRWNLTSQ